MTMQMNEMFYGGNEPHWLKNDEYQRPYDYTADLVYPPTSGRALPTHEFRVPMCCPKCEEKVREELSELDGVYEIFVDQVHERVTVTGFVDPFQALKKMKRIKKKSQFWDGPSSSTSASRLKYSSHKRDQSFSYHKKPHHSRHQETVYRASPSQISFNRQPRPRLNKFDGSYDDEVSYSGYRNSSYDDEVSYSGHRNKFYDDGLSYRPASAFNRKYHGAFDDQEISYRPANKFSGAYDDEIAYRYRNQYSDSPYLRPSSSLFSRSVRYESVPPFAQEYYTEEPMEQYPFFTPY